MAKMSGTFTSIKGKIGNVVACGWKGIQVLKTRTIPANPQSPDQTSQRNKMLLIVQRFKCLAVNFVRPAWNPFAGDHSSGWGRFLSANLLSMTSGFNIINAVMSQGSLEGIYNFSATYNSTTGEVVFSYDGTIYGNGAADDLISIIYYDADAEAVAAVSLDYGERSAGLENDDIPTGMDATKLYVFAVVHRGNMSLLDITDIANSIYAVCTAA